MRTRPLWNRFDYIACICYTGYKDRQLMLSNELSRIGLLDRTNFFWDVSSPYTKSLAKLSCRDKYHQKMFPVGYNNYRAIKTAYELGHSSILVMEDDIRFLKDLSKIRNAISMLPQDFEIAMMDKNFPSDEWKKYRQHNPKAERESQEIVWRGFCKFYSSGCYALSRKGMEMFIRAYERDGSLRRLKNNDEYFNCNVFDKNKMYAAFPNVAIQGVIGIGGSCSPLEDYWTANEYQGGWQSMYNLECPCVTKDNFLRLLYAAVDRDVQPQAHDVLKSGKRTYCSLPDDCLNSIKSATVPAEINEQTTGLKYDAVIIWGNGIRRSNLVALQIAYRDNAPVLLCEDGFIRSYTTWVDKSAPSQHRLGHSVILDSSAYYFDAIRVSTVEKMLNDKEFKVTAEQCAEARRLIDKIVSTKVSKYNHQPIYKPQIGRDGVRKVLVVDQSYGDFSIARGMADEQTFVKMLEAAKRENPDADILVKTHPDTIVGKKGEKKGYYQDVKEEGNVYKVTFPINPYSLMEMCDKVYVCSSGMGMEALMAGKEVHVFGMPFYAGWGLTVDDQHLDRRTNKRSLDELFYIFYCMYTHWIDPAKGRETTLDNVIDKMVNMRTIFQGTPTKIRHMPPRTSSVAPLLPNKRVVTPVLRGRTFVTSARKQRLA